MGTGGCLMPSVPLSDWSHMMENQNDQVLVTRKTELTGAQKAGYLFAGLLGGAGCAILASLCNIDGRTARIAPSSRSSASASESRCRSSATSPCCPSRRCSTDYPIKARKRPSRRLDATGGSFHAGMMRRQGERRKGDGYGKGGAVGAVMRFAWVTDGGGQG